MNRGSIRFATGRHSIPLVLWLLLSSSYADTDLKTLEGQLGMVNTFVTDLDAHAGRCRKAGIISTACSEFKMAANVEALTRYQTLCEPLVRWRDSMIIQQSGSDDDSAALTAPEAERTVQLLLKLEERCGSNALTQRTKHIRAAYSYSGISTARASSALDSTITKIESQRINSLDLFSDSHNRLRDETSAHWRRLQIQNELQTQQRLQINLSNPSLQ